MKVIKKGIRKAILFYYDEDKQLPRMVMFGELEELMSFYFDMSEAAIKRLQAMTKKVWGKDMNADEMLKMIHDTKPSWMKDNSSAAEENMKMDLTYEVKKC